MTEHPASDRAVTAGDNEPQPLVSIGLLEAVHGGLMLRIAELEHEARNQPARVDDDEAQGALQDVIKRIDDCGKLVETTREGTKAPFLQASRVIDGFFNGSLRDRLVTIRRKLATTGKEYLQRKEAVRRAEAEARAAALRAAELAQREAQRKAEEAAAKARSVSQAAQREQEARVAGHLADAADDAARAAEQASQAKPAEFARTRSTVGGSLGTLRSEWAYEITDYEAIPAGPLWAYISRDAKEKAIRAYIKTHAPKDESTLEWNTLTGLRIYRTTEAEYR
jgi:flagellar biosynthesis GTPase FlhF